MPHKETIFKIIFERMSKKKIIERGIGPQKIASKGQLTEILAELPGNQNSSQIGMLAGFIR